MATSDSEATERKAFLRFAGKAALLLPVLLLAPVVNYTVDPANLFADEGKQEAEMGAALISGKKVVNFDRYEDRRIATYLLENRRDRPNVLVLGSSRTLNMGSYLFPNSKVMNGSMLAGTIREVLAAYQIVHRRGLKPDTVILGVDPWMLNADAFDERWTAVKPHFDSALTVLGIQNWPGHKDDPERHSRFEALFSADYFQQSIKSVRNGQSRPKWYLSDSAENEGFTRLPDGSYTYSRYQRTKSTSEADALAAKYTSESVYLLNENARLDSTHLRAIVQLLALIRRDGSQPVLYLPPYHPLVYASLAADSRRKIVIESEVALRKEAARLAVPVVGSYNPILAGLTNADFYDGHHLKESGLLKVFKP